MEEQKHLIIVRGGGDLATGTIHKLNRCGYPVLVLETGFPSAIRRHVAFSEAVYDGASEVEGTVCVKASGVQEALAVMERGDVALLVDPECRVLDEVRPWALVDAILAKKNLGTTRDMAPKTIGLGPGFEAGKDVDLVIETMRGHNLGRIIGSGSALPNTGVPGTIGGYGKERFHGRRADRRQGEKGPADCEGGHRPRRGAGERHPDRNHPRGHPGLLSGDGGV